MARWSDALNPTILYVTVCVLWIMMNISLWLGPSDFQIDLGSRSTRRDFEFFNIFDPPPKEFHKTFKFDFSAFDTSLKFNYLIEKNKFKCLTILFWWRIENI